MDELRAKLETVRSVLRQEGLAGIRLRGTDWFAWATCGGSSVVLLAAETGVAQVLITEEAACVLTDEIEQARLREEEVPNGYELYACRWTETAHALDRYVRERTTGGRVASDRPVVGEEPLPQALLAARSTLLPEELARYGSLAAQAAEAMTEVLSAANPDWTGYQLAGAGAQALWIRGIEPTLTLVGGERRLPIHRHATASAERLGSRAMLVFCGRRHGLFANLTRFVYFRPPTPEERAIDDALTQIEADALDALRPGVTLGRIYEVLVDSYARAGHAGAERAHHQGGTCGYRSRDVVATPGSTVTFQRENAVAFNPSLPGAKIEDTVVVSGNGLSIVTTDPRWPSRTVRGRRRPDLLLR